MAAAGRAGCRTPTAGALNRSVAVGPGLRLDAVDCRPEETGGAGFVAEIGVAPAPIIALLIARLRPERYGTLPIKAGGAASRIERSRPCGSAPPKTYLLSAFRQTCMNVPLPGLVANSVGRSFPVAAKQTRKSPLASNS